MAGQIRQAETAKIRKKIAPELVNKKNRHQITFIEDGFSITENDDGTQTAQVQIALKDYNALENPQDIFVEATQNYILMKGISNLSQKQPKWLYNFSEFTEPGFQSAAMQSFYLENRQAITAAALLAQDNRSCQKIITGWMTDTNQIYTTANNTYISEFHPSTIENFVQNAIGAGFIQLKKNKDSKLTI